MRRGLPVLRGPWEEIAVGGAVPQSPASGRRDGRRAGRRRESAHRGPERRERSGSSAPIHWPLTALGPLRRILLKEHRRRLRFGLSQGQRCPWRVTRQRPPGVPRREMPLLGPAADRQGGLLFQRPTVTQSPSSGWGARDRTWNSCSKGRRVARYTTPQNDRNVRARVGRGRMAASRSGDRRDASR